MWRALVIGLVAATHAHAGHGSAPDAPVVALVPAVIGAWLMLPACASLIVLRAFARADAERGDGAHRRRNAIIGLAGVGTSALLIAFTAVTNTLPALVAAPLVAAALVFASPPGSRPVRKLVAVMIVVGFLIWVGFGIGFRS